MPGMLGGEPMTDDKGAGEGRYGHMRSTIAGKCLSGCPLCAFRNGRKAEREIIARLLAYAQHRDSCGDMDAENRAELSSCNCGLDGLKDAIRGGQDGK